MQRIIIDRSRAAHQLPAWRGVMTEWMFSPEDAAAGRSTDPSGQVYDAGGVRPLQEQDIALAAEMGATLIRCSIEHTSLEDPDRPGAYREAGFERIATLLQWYAKYGVSAILDLHNALGREYGGDPRLWKQRDYQDRFVGVWREIARRFGQHPQVVALEPMNEPEPPDDCIDVWNDLVQRTVPVIREHVPEKPIIVDSTGYANPGRFPQLATIDDEHAIYSFHWYGPSRFHNQKRPWLKDQGTYHYPDTYDDLWWDRETIRQQLEPALAFARAHDVPLFCGEFGCVSETPEMEDVIWLLDVVSLFDELSIDWTYFHFMFRTADPMWDGRYDCNLLMRDPRDQSLRRLDRKADLMSDLMRLRGRWIPVELDAASEVHVVAIALPSGAVQVYAANRSRTSSKPINLRLGAEVISAMASMQPGNSAGWQPIRLELDDAGNVFVDLQPLQVLRFTATMP